MKNTPDDERETWEEVYRNQDVEELPWYSETLDSDLERILVKLNIASGKILDLGTGPGTQAITLAEMGFKVTATDISGIAIEKAGRIAKENGLNIDFRQDDITRTKIEGKFDVVFDRGCFHTLSPEDRNGYVNTVYGMLNSGGHLFLKCFSHKEKGKDGPNRFTPKQIREYFGTNFQIISVADSTFKNSTRPPRKALFCAMKK